MIFKDYAEQKDFERWAFGHSPVSYMFNDMHAWNSRWGDVLWLEGDENFASSLTEMVGVYRDATKDVVEMTLKEEKAQPTPMIVWCCQCHQIDTFSPRRGFVWVCRGCGSNAFTGYDPKKERE